MLEHYFHEYYQFRSKRRNIHPIKIKKNSKLFSHSYSNNKIQQQSASYQTFVCMSNGNAIQIYKISQQSVDFLMKKQFFCNIAKIQVIPSNYHDTDFIFILDDLGRYAFWKPGEEEIHAQNVIGKQDRNKRYYREELSPQEEEQFSGTDFRFDVKDTVGYIFFTVQNKLTLIYVTVKAKQGLKVVNVRNYQIPYTRFRFINCLKLSSSKNSQFVFGIVQQLQQKTALKIHTLDPSNPSILIDQDSLTFKIQKTNLLWFSFGQNQQIIVLTYDQISIYKYKSSNYLCNYRTRGNYGSVCYIQPTVKKNSSPYNNLQSLSVNNKTKNIFQEATYIHLGFQMTVFTKNRLNNYGPLKIQNKNLLQGCGIVQSKYLGCFGNGSFMISFVTNFNQVYFVMLFENRWRLIRKIQSLSSIFSINQLSDNSNPRKLVAVHSSLQEQSEITHLQFLSPTILQQQQTLENTVIQSIHAIHDGQSLIISSDQKNSLLSFAPDNKKWIDSYQFQNKKDKILCCTPQGDHIIMTSGIYKLGVKKYIQLNSQFPQQLILENINKQQNILSAICNKNFIGYYTSQGTFKFYQFESKSITRIRKNCIQEYIWHLLSQKNILISAAYSQIGQLRVLPITKIAKKITLQTKQLVSSIHSISYQPPFQSNKMIDQNNQDIIYTDLVIGFHNGDIQVYSLERNTTIFKFNIGSQMVNISQYRSNHMIAYTKSKQYILAATKQGNNRNLIQSKTNIGSRFSYQLHQIEISDLEESKIINKLIYLPMQDKLLVTFYNLTNNASSAFSQSTIIQLRSLKLKKKLSDDQLTMELKSSIRMETIFRTQSGEAVPFIEIKNNQDVFIALPESILKYNLKKKQLIKKQLHLLKQIVAIQKCQQGILVAGVDVMETGSVILFDYQDLSIKSTYNLGNNKPTALKSLKNPKYSNRFFIKYQTYLSLLQIQPTLIITHIKTVNTKTVGYTLDINQQENKILLSDSYRYISVWDYDLQIASYDILSVSKYFGSYLINDCCWLDNTVVTADRGGRISLLELNLGNQVTDLNKINMSKVGEIYIGQEVFSLTKSQKKNTPPNNETQKLQIIDQTQQKKTLQQSPTLQHSTLILYGTSSGSIGLIKTIPQPQFKLLKKIQLDCLKYIDKKQRFSYEQWRKRLPQNDKLIDSSLIKYFLNEFRFKVTINQEEFYDEVKKIYEKLVGTVKDNN